jgi:hypothetical protein
MRKSLQITLLILSLIPLIFGLSGVILGTGRFLDPAAIVPQLDSQFRYLSGLHWVRASAAAFDAPGHPPLAYD